MPTGTSHDRVVNSMVNGQPHQEIFPCRCTIGDVHFEGPSFLDEPESDSHPFGEAEDILKSSGYDPDYDFT